MVEQKFDVFLCHNSEDKDAVIEIAERLKTKGIKPWLDIWQLRPGLDWQDGLDKHIEQIQTAAVFVGNKGFGPWQAQEVKAFLREFCDRGCPVIPVLLSDAPKEPTLPTFLKGKMWVDFRRGEPDPFGRLMWGITGVSPFGTDEPDDSLIEPVVTRRAIATAANFEDAYLACQAADCQRLRSEGAVQHDGIFVPLLRDVFVPLTLDSNATFPGFKGLKNELSAEICRSYSIWDFLAKAEAEATFRQLAILAWGGYGKTTLLKHVAFRLGTKQPSKEVPQRVPFLLVLRKYREILTQENSPSLPELIMQHHIPKLAGAGDLSIPSEWANDVLRSGSALVMFDGFDEVAKEYRPVVAKWLNEQMRQYDKSVFIVTSRPMAYKKQDAASQLVLSSPLWVKDFDAEQRRNFVTNWYGCQVRYANAGRETPDVKQEAAELATDLLEQIESQLELKDLAKNPLLLNMIATFYRRYTGASLPERKVELYQEICQLQLRDKPRARRRETLLTHCKAQTILQLVAFEMMRHKLERVERQVLLGYVAEALARNDEAIEASVFLEQVVQVSELIVQQEDEYEFAHLSFQEYLAAAHIAAKPGREVFLYEYLKEDWWKQTILLYTGLVNPTQLVREMMRQDLTDLAYESLQQTSKHVDNLLQSELKQKRTVIYEPVDTQELIKQPSNEISDDEMGSASMFSSLKKTLTKARYADLEEYLKDGQWERANEETYRLMITEVGKDEGQWFDQEDLLTFACEPLKIIDERWVMHSDGRFGFSVQKEMYVECGGALDGRFDKEAWSRLCQMNGWNSNGLEIRQLGCFPRLGEARSMGHVCCSLFVRIQVCKL